MSGLRTQAAVEGLDGLPLGTKIAAAFINGNDGTAAVILFEHRVHEGKRQWWDLTHEIDQLTSLDIALGFDDMVIITKPDGDPPATKMTGRLRFRYSDGSYLEWSTKEPTTPAHVRDTIERFAALDRLPSGGQS